ncbi:hypothetical protein [Gilliamella sp. ESL0250]|uniref:hypothetical protein n=1 Tax=Gilliamella sp. ESL0250 TaxID=2705036 RepID=UPI00158061AC|nr:hypothetical protein [Gilliamella sp. ESL0250]NUF48480.1 hypothetical protein [Gilliamella sp. ESL0250]
MKNNYVFKNLANKEFVLGTDKQDIFFNMLDVVRKGNLTLFTQSFSDLVYLLEKDSYYIAHHLIVYKGKKAIFAGQLVRAFKAQLIDFIQHAINHDDLRPFLISSIFMQDCKRAFYLTEEGFYLYDVK